MSTEVARVKIYSCGHASHVERLCQSVSDLIQNLPQRWSDSKKGDSDLQADPPPRAPSWDWDRW